MEAVRNEHDLSLAMVGDIPVRMFYAGRTWTITDMPTRLRESVWSAAVARSPGLYGWRFQATDDNDETFVFDVFRAETDWHVHRTYA